jgi:uncharacterized protein
MKFQVSLKPNAKAEKVEKLGEGELRVWVNAPPVEGKANAALIKLLAEHFGVPKSQVKITHGLKSKKKIVEIVP